MNVFTHSEAGGKVQNEDFVLARRHPADSGMWICCVADGQGGRANGAAAARMACESFHELARAAAPESLFDQDRLRILLEQSDAQVMTTEGYTTLVVAVVTGVQIIGGSSGDSKMYARQPNGEITELTSRQNKNPPVGSGGAQFELFAAGASDFDRMLMVSDGAWKYGGYEALRRALDAVDFGTAAPQLRAETLARCGTSLPDDFSLIGIDPLS